MTYQVLAEWVIILHFLWIIFMLIGFVLTVCGIFFYRKFMDMLIFRTIHLLGILFVAILTILNKYCPLTILEYNLQKKYDSTTVFSQLFIISYLEKLVYPDVNPLVIQLPTIFIAIFTIVVFIIIPPIKKKVME